MMAVNICLIVVLILYLLINNANKTSLSIQPEQLEAVEDDSGKT